MRRLLSIETVREHIAAGYEDAIASARDRIVLSRGNTKVPTLNTSTYPMVDCDPSACAHCLRQCYARRSLRYAGVRRAWSSNSALWRDVTRHEQAIADIVAACRRSSAGRMRWSVAGDIVSQSHADAIVQVAQATRQTRHLVYTKRPGIQWDTAPNLAVLYGMWPSAPDTYPAEVRRAWVADPHDPDPRIPAGAYRCPGSCAKCSFCWAGKRDVVFAAH